MSTIYNPMLLCDYYKLSHRSQYLPTTSMIYSTWTHRMSRIPGVTEAVAFGFQGFVQTYLVDYFNKHFFGRQLAEIVADYRRIVTNTLGVSDPDVSHIEALHGLGYLPIRIKAVKEGTLVPIRCPMLTIENTQPEFFWLTNYLETLMSNYLWMPTTSATIAHQYRKILDEYAMKTTGSTDVVQFQGHDFSMRGLSCLEAACTSGAGHLLSFVGSDTIPAIQYLEAYYCADVTKELVGCSVSASEHSVACANGQDELVTFRRLITEIYPSGFVSIVSDTWDYWSVLTTVLPQLKNVIMARDGRVIIRPDSGIPEDIICGLPEDVVVVPDYYDNTEAAVLKCGINEIKERYNDQTPHGELGETDWILILKQGDKYYELKAYVYTDRYDKQFYFLDEVKMASFTQIDYVRTPEQKGTIELLWDLFGGTVNEQGYKVLDSHIGCIYGDAITLDRCETICKRLAAKGFASTNMVYGIGSFSYQHNTRDTLGFALKSTHSVVDGQEVALFKDPKTDTGHFKKSQKGMVAVLQDDQGQISYVDGLTIAQRDAYESRDLLEDIFVDGQVTRIETLANIRARLAAGRA